MIYFYIGENEELITKLTLNDIQWLIKFNIIKKGLTGFLLHDSSETLPFFEDYILTYNNALSMNIYSKNTISKLLSTPGFHSEVLDKYCLIINTILTTRETINVRCD